LCEGYHNIEMAILTSNVGYCYINASTPTT
jgi:hypothetical protein